MNNQLKVIRYVLIVTCFKRMSIIFKQCHLIPERLLEQRQVQLITLSPSIFERHFKADLHDKCQLSDNKLNP